jgi:hypothetical protein
MPNSVATIRIKNVVNDGGVVSVRACYFRVGRRSDTHVIAGSNLRIPVNIVSGVLDKYGYRTDWIEIDNHPDTKFIFDKKQIPDFDKCIDVIIGLHTMVPFTSNIGWDVVFDENYNVKVMEWRP